MSDRQRWTLDQAAEWTERLSHVRGCNYLPRTCVNPTQMWQDPAAHPIDQELAWAAEIGLNSLRVFMSYAVYVEDPGAYVYRMERFLEACANHQLSVLFVLFDDCWGPEPLTGPQPAPIPGVHNSRWTACPGQTLKAEQHWPELAHYVRDLVYYFSRDQRIIGWDLFNEAQPASRPLVEAAFRWAREAAPMQPLTACWQADDLSDVISFHCYLDTDTPAFARDSDQALSHGRPVLCTECLARTQNNHLAAILPHYVERGIGWYVWGLVSGASQTRFPWGCPVGGPEPYQWFHDLLYPDGRPYDANEIALIRAAAER